MFHFVFCVNRAKTVNYLAQFTFVLIWIYCSANLCKYSYLPGYRFLGYASCVTCDYRFKLLLLNFYYFFAGLNIKSHTYNSSWTTWTIPKTMPRFPIQHIQIVAATVNHEEGKCLKLKEFSI